MEKKFTKMSPRWDRCRMMAPDIFSILRESRTLGTARRRMMTYLEASEIDFHNDYFEMSNWEFILTKDALNVLKNLFAKNNELVAETSPLRYLWQASRTGDSEVDDGFIDEFVHLFRAIKGSASVYPSPLMEGIVSPDFDKYRGRESATRRSRFLDNLGDRMDDFLQRCASGLDSQVEARRQSNKKRILDIFGGNEADWADYRWQYKNVIRNKNGLERMKKYTKLTRDENRAIVMALENGIPFGITPHYLHLMDPLPNGSDFAVRRQVIPPINYVKSMISHKKDRRAEFDYMREYDTSPIEHITRRYAKVLVLKPYDTCPQICVYCQRNWEITSPFEKSAQVSQKELDRALNWVAKHPQIMDILITGGDPLIMSNDKLESLLAKLASIPHIKSIRIATRTPVSAPQRIDSDLVDILAKYNEPFKRFIYIVTHFQHTYELCHEGADAIARLRQRGINSYNQQVFTFANSRRFESVALRMGLKMIGVDPYYLFNMKGKSEMHDYSVPIARVLQEQKEEARLLPGIYRTDEPVFNVPFLGKNHLRAQQDHELISILPDGCRIYAFHPWEKNIRGVRSYIYTDVSIREYLDRLKQRGEDIQEYRTIWFYY